MKKLLSIILFTGIILFSMWSEVSDAEWHSRYEKTVDATLASQAVQISSCTLMNAQRKIINKKVESIKNPEQAGLLAAQILTQMDRDLRSGKDIQEAGARFEQSVRIITFHAGNNVENNLEKGSLLQSMHNVTEQKNKINQMLITTTLDQRERLESLKNSMYGISNRLESSLWNDLQNKFPHQGTH